MSTCQGDSDEFISAVMETVERVKKQLAGLGAPLQGAVLAELTSLWVCGHQLDGSAAEQHHLWESLVRMQSNTIRDLVEAEWLLRTQR